MSAKVVSPRVESIIRPCNVKGGIGIERLAIALQHLGTDIAKSTDRKHRTGIDTRKKLVGEMAMSTQIFSDNGFKNFSTGDLISSQSLCEIPFDEGSIWEALKPGEEISLSDGDFILDKNFKLIKFVGYDECGEATYLIDGKVMDGYQAHSVGLC